VRYGLVLSKMQKKDCTSVHLHFGFMASYDSQCKKFEQRQQIDVCNYDGLCSL
jgi:hypothetical protein